ncbi:DNA-binding MarR family transcriptional regulator [Mesorhizobium sp. RMAD-H1]|nr:DNA-binding MarR family transcriptional regulator [Mesorhizobium sp. RMAD-H1]
MDAATTKGVVARLIARGLIRMEKDEEDRRRHNLSTTQEGRKLLDDVMPQVRGITEATLAPLTPAERATLVKLLKRLI